MQNVSAVTLWRIKIKKLSQSPMFHTLLCFVPKRIANFAIDFISAMTSKEFETYFRRLYLPLGMYAMRLVGDAEIAEDLEQDAFMKAWLYVDNGGEIVNFTSFMYRTVHNVCLKHLRDRHEMLGEESIPEMIDEDIDTSFRDAAVWKAIDTLPEKCRRVFLMSKRDGLSNNDIACELGISVKTVKNQMTKAYSRLREALSDGHKPFFLPFL